MSNKTQTIILIISQDYDYACMLKEKINKHNQFNNTFTFIFQNIEYACENLKMRNFVDLVIVDNTYMKEYDKLWSAFPEKQIGEILVLNPNQNVILGELPNSRIKLVGRDDAFTFENYLISFILDSKTKDSSLITLCFNNRIIKLLQTDIIALEKVSKDVVIYTRSNKLKIRSSLKAICDHLNNDFLKVHQGYVVNLSYVVKYEKRLLELKELNLQVPVSRRSVQSLKERLVQGY
ncbi:LytTR family DNA-binding domain-containing protein [Fusibacter sp. JL216-2]|uniref:LytTR family DNA-binding domain-containing protein n=1 Tax=Fusibacter sp. JL216-2 TaxID=3071453 RepID=UPI003D346D89